MSVALPRRAIGEPHRILAFGDDPPGDLDKAALLLLATTGARRGEVLGLRWTDVNLDAGRAAIRQTVIAVHHRVQFGEPKTARGRRTIDFDAVTVTALREHRKRQVAERLLMGAGWTDQGLVFCRVDGGLLPRAVHPAHSGIVPGSSDCPRSACMIFGTAGQRARCRCAPEGGAGAARARHDRRHAGHLLARDSWHAQRRRSR
jgi:integrase